MRSKLNFFQMKSLDLFFFKLLLLDFLLLVYFLSLQTTAYNLEKRILLLVGGFLQTQLDLILASHLLLILNQLTHI